MPTVLKNRVQGTDADMVKARPTHLAAIGLVAVSWTSIEEGLQMFFQQLLSYQMAMDWYQHDHPLLLANVGMILPVVESLRTKLDLIGAVAEANLPKKMCEEWESTYVPLIRKTASKRAKIVHGRWGYSDQFPTHIILRDAKAKTDTLYTEKDILFVANEIREADERASRFFIKCHHAYGAGRPDNPPVQPRQS